MISGRLICNQSEDFAGTEVVIGFNGSELTNFRIIKTDREHMYAGKFVFINASNVIHNFEEPLSPKGQHVYPFEFKTAEWLPSSTVFSAEFSKSHFKIRYGMWAQIKPLNVNDYVD